MLFRSKSCSNPLIATLLLAPMLAAPPALAERRATRDLTVEQKSLAKLAIPVSDLKVTAWVDRRDETYSTGDTVRLFVRTNRDAYITVINVGTSGKVHILFPNRHHGDNRVLAHQVLQIPGTDAPYRIRVGGPPGNELIKVIATTRPGRLIPADRLSEHGPFSSYKGPTQKLTRDLSVELEEKHRAGPKDGAAMVNKVIRIVGDGAAAAPPPGRELPAKAAGISAAELFRLAEASFYGDGAARDHREALRLLGLAAEAGHVGAMFRIGRIHEAGIDVEADAGLARRWYRKAAELGNTQAMVRLALIHARTDGARRDYAAAVRWLRKAADHGDGVAMLNLARMHDEGIGVERSPRAAARHVLGALKAGAWTILDQAGKLSSATRREVQTQLRQAGHYAGAVDGRIGPETRAAMVDFARTG